MPGNTKAMYSSVRTSQRTNPRRCADRLARVDVPHADPGSPVARRLPPPPAVEQREVEARDCEERQVQHRSSRAGGRLRRRDRRRRGDRMHVREVARHDDLDDEEGDTDDQPVEHDGPSALPPARQLPRRRGRAAPRSRAPGSATPIAPTVAERPQGTAVGSRASATCRAPGRGRRQPMPRGAMTSRPTPQSRRRGQRPLLRRRDRRWDQWRHRSKARRRRGRRRIGNRIAPSRRSRHRTQNTSMLASLPAQKPPVASVDGAHAQVPSTATASTSVLQR